MVNFTADVNCAIRLFHFRLVVTIMLPGLPLPLHRYLHAVNGSWLCLICDSLI
jgi:hypothetical protein